MPEPIPNALAAVLEGPDVGEIVELFAIDLSKWGDGLRRFAPAPVDSGFPSFAGETYAVLPFESDGWEWSADGPLPTPRLSFLLARDDGDSAAPAAALLALVDLYDGFLGASVTRLRTLRKHLDDGDDPDGDAVISAEIYEVEQITSRTGAAITFRLRSGLDHEDVDLPRRRTLSRCPYIYRSHDAARAAVLLTAPASWTAGGAPDPSFDLRAALDLSALDEDDFNGGLPGRFGFSRGSPASEIAEGRVVMRAANAPRPERDESGAVIGLLRERESTALAGGALFTVSGASVSAFDAVPLYGDAFPEARRVISNGGTWGRAHRAQYPVVSGQPVGIEAFVAPGLAPSGRVRFILRDGAGLAGITRVAGAFGAVAMESASDGGAISDLTETVIGASGMRRYRFVWTPNFTGAASIGVGPDAWTAGQDIVRLGVNVTAGGLGGSHIPEAAGAVTRAGDALLVDIAGLIGERGYVMLDGDFPDDAPAGAVLAEIALNSGNRHRLLRSGPDLRASVVAGSASGQITRTGGWTSAGRVILAWSETGARLYAGGAEIGSLSGDFSLAETKVLRLGGSSIESGLEPGGVIRSVAIGAHFLPAAPAAFDYSRATCPYTGPAMFDLAGDPVGEPALDRCGKRLADCRARFGAAELPFGGFPGVGRLRTR